MGMKLGLSNKGGLLILLQGMVLMDCFENKMNTSANKITYDVI